MFTILIRNQLWSLIPKMVSDFRVEHQKYNFWGTQNHVFWHFWVPKNCTSGAQNQNLKPDLETVTKTDSKTGFRFEF